MIPEPDPQTAMDAMMAEVAYGAYETATYGVYAANHDEGLRSAIAAVAPLIRAQERAAVRAELLAIAAEDRALTSSDLLYLVREIADRIAPEGATRG